MTFLVPDGMVQVAFVAIGATMVGCITFLKKEGDYVHKGDEVFSCISPYYIVTVSSDACVKV